MFFHSVSRTRHQHYFWMPAFLKLTTILALLLLTIVIFGSSCSRSHVDQQLRFGITAAQRDLWDEAIFRWKKVLQDNPKSAAAHNNLAVAYEKKGLLEEAKREYEKALKLKPGNSFIKTNYENFMEKYKALQKKEDEN